MQPSGGDWRAAAVRNRKRAEWVLSANHDFACGEFTTKRSRATRVIHRGDHEISMCCKTSLTTHRPKRARAYRSLSQYLLVLPGKLVNTTPCRYSRHSCIIRAKVANLPTSSNAATRKGKIKIFDKVSYSPVFPVQRV